MGLLRRRLPETPEAAPGTPEFSARATIDDVAALASKGDLAGVASLAASPGKDVRREVVRTLSATATAETSAALRSVFEKETDLAIRQSAAEALAARGDLLPVEALLLEGPPEAQSRAARVLLGLGEAGISILAAALARRSDSLTLRILRVVELHFRLGSDEQQAALRKGLEVVVPALVAALDATEITGGARSYSEVTAVTVAALTNLKDERAVIALDRLLRAIQAKVDREGVERLFVDDGVKAGYVSPLDEMKHLTSAIVACGGAGAGARP